MNNSDEPITPLHPEYGINDMPYRGLTKREHFAGLAMQGLLANPNVVEKGGTKPDHERIQIMAVSYADNVLKELSND